MQKLGEYTRWQLKNQCIWSANINKWYLSQLNVPEVKLNTQIYPQINKYSTATMNYQDLGISYQPIYVLKERDKEIQAQYVYGLHLFQPQ